MPVHTKTEREKKGIKRGPKGQISKAKTKPKAKPKAKPKITAKKPPSTSRKRPDSEESVAYQAFHSAKARELRQQKRRKDVKPLGFALGEAVVGDNPADIPEGPPRPRPRPRRLPGQVAPLRKGSLPERPLERPMPPMPPRAPKPRPMPGAPKSAAPTRRAPKPRPMPAAPKRRPPKIVVPKRRAPKIVTPKRAIKRRPRK